MNHYLKYCEACNEPMIANTGGYWCPNANCQGNRPVVTRNYSAPAPLADSPVPPSPVGETMEDGFYDWFESMAPPTANQMSRALWHKTIRAAWDAGCAWTNLAILERADPTLMQRKAGEAVRGIPDAIASLITLSNNAGYCDKHGAEMDPTYVRQIAENAIKHLQAVQPPAPDVLREGQP